MKTIIAILILATLATAQLSDKTIKPKSFSVFLKKNLETITLPALNTESIKAIEENEKFQDLAPRYGIAHMLSDSPFTIGKYENIEGGRVWRVHFKSPGAFFTVVEFDLFKLAKGATLHAIDSTGYVYGAYTEANNNEKTRVFSAGPFHGEDITFELFEPENTASILKLKSISRAYKDLFGYKNKNGRSGTCNIEVSCPQGEKWKNQTQSVGLLLQGTTSRFCTGSFINNANQDGRQLFLTAAHCGSNPKGWGVILNYHSKGCRVRRADLPKDSYRDIKSIVRNTRSDVHLLEVGDKVAEKENLYFSGFNAENKVDGGAVGIHHPSGDNKKIALTSIQIIDGRWGNGPQGTHWRVPRWTEGTTEPGSSGSPLFDNNQRIIGQLHGGTASCWNRNGYDVYGKLWQSMKDNADLRKALFPNGKVGIEVLDGISAKNIAKNLSK